MHTAGVQCSLDGSRGQHGDAGHSGPTVSADRKNMGGGVEAGGIQLVPQSRQLHIQAGAWREKSAIATPCIMCMLHKDNVIGTARRH